MDTDTDTFADLSPISPISRRQTWYRKVIQPFSRRRSSGQSYLGEPAADYVYEPLASRDSVRLLTMWPAEDAADPIRCTMTEHPWCDPAFKGKYKALSYTWGSSMERLPITVNARTIWITPNLYAALQQLRDQDESTVWWIDAICINQRDQVEQGHQVAHMRDVYLNSKQTVAWLGPSGENSDLAMVFIEQGWPAGHIPSLKLVLALHDLFLRPYWSRVWVIQELTVAFSVVFMCGSYTVARERLVPILSRPWSLNAGISDPQWRQDRFFLIKTVPSYYSTRSLRLEKLVFYTDYALATDPRDKVFALIGLLSQGSGWKIYPDYTMSPCQVYRKAIQAMMWDRFELDRESHPDLKALLVAVHGILNERCMHRPSSDANHRGSTCTGIECGTRQVCFNLPSIWRAPARPIHHRRFEKWVPDQLFQPIKV